MSAKQAYFSPAAFDFLRKLKRNNNREWFLKHRSTYESDVRDPALRFITDVGPRIKTISPHLLADARPVGGSLFRINRDIRFSADKSPYKTNIGISFGHDRSREDAAPGLYLHIEPGTTWAGGGIHMPDGATLTRVRDAIVKDSATWKRITREKRFAPMFENMGDALKRAPQGYDPNHALVEDLKRKSYVWHAHFSEAQVCAPDFMDRYVEACVTAAPFTRLLAKAVRAPW
jgi:uncharacterized protein (TIGR02453 family)